MKKDQKYLWKYLSLDKFDLMLKDKVLYLPSLKKLQISMDPIEGATLQRLINSVVKQIENADKIAFAVDKQNPSLGKCLHDIKKESIRFINQLVEAYLNYNFVYSLSFSERENYSLWHIYTTDLSGQKQPNQGIAVRINERYFKKLFCNSYIKINNNVYNLQVAKPVLENIIYLSNQKISEIVNNNKKVRHEEFFNILHNALLIKNDFYKFAKEKRYIVGLKYDADAVQKCNFNSNESYITINFDVQEFFQPDNCKVIISPFANDSFIEYVKYLLKQQNIRSVDEIVMRSEISIPK